MNQRWREHRSSYRPAGEPIATARYEVAEIAGDAEPKAFVEAHHYAASYPAARFRFGLYRGGRLVGVAVFSMPCTNAVLTNVFPVPALEACELGRFVLLDDVEGNGESWFLARCFELLRAEIAGVVSFSDPVPRTNETGATVFPGHYGCIYQATNAVYTGLSTPRSLHLLPDGTVLSPRAIQKIRKQERGWLGVCAKLERFGAEPIAGDPRGWLETWLPRLTRRLRHPGNHRYAFALDKRLRPQLLARAQKYPKPKETSCDDTCSGSVRS